MIVTVGGLPGTGTSTLCRLLERELGLPYVYAGQIFRQEAAARGLSLAELNELACTTTASTTRWTTGSSSSSAGAM
jgi:cytidylate kinase